MEKLFLKNKLKDKGLKVTPQRMVVLKAIFEEISHPSAESLIIKIRENNSDLAIGTIYNILDTFVSKGIIVKIQTDKNQMRYDPITEEHHHIYLKEDDEIIDYFDQELTKIVKEYLITNKSIKGIDIQSININIFGKKVKI